MRVLLVSGNTHTQPYPVYPLGLDYVAGAIAERHPVGIADMSVPGGGEALGKAIEAFKPEAVGLSIRNVDTTDTTRPGGLFAGYRGLVDAIRSQTDALLILGGSGFSIFPDRMMRELGADYGIVGEGERLPLLLDALERREDVPALPGIVTPNAPAAMPPPWTREIARRFDPSLPHVSFYLKRGGMLNVQTKRGCGFNCIYCTYPVIEGRSLRLFDPEEVGRTARRLQAAGAQYLFITDAAFNSSAAHSLAVARAFKRAGVSVPWGGFFTPTAPDSGYYRALADAGLAHVEFGTESLSDRVLKAYRKPFRCAHVLDAHAAASEAGLHVAHYFLLGGPGETSDTLAETLDGVERLRRGVLFFFCGMRIYPQTELYELALRDGQVRERQNLLEPVFFKPAGMDDREILKRVRERAGGRPNWVVGDGGEKSAAVVSRLHAHGHCGPLWEHLARR